MKRGAVLSTVSAALTVFATLFLILYFSSDFFLLFMESILRPVFNDVEALLMSVVPFFYVVALILGILSIRIKKRIKALGVIILVVDVIGSLICIFMLAFMASWSSAW